MENVIEVQRLVKRYGTFTAVDGIDLRVKRGQLYAFLGPNGAGKSTTINILCTLLQKDAGTVTVAGFSADTQGESIRRRIGVVFQDNVLDSLLTVEENLLTRGALYGLTGRELKKNLGHIAQVMDIKEILRRPFGKLSGGQKRRAEIARALMNSPEILILDEPTTGLDPQTRINVWQIISRLQAELGMTVFLTTHYMEEAGAAHYADIIDHGKIVASGTPGQLKAQYSTDTLRLVPADTAALLATLQAKGLQPQTTADALALPVKDSLTALALLKELEGQYRAFEVIKGSMDDVFVNITGHAIREDA